jgi:hypothetical protein
VSTRRKASLHAEHLSEKLRGIGSALPSYADLSGIVELDDRRFSARTQPNGVDYETEFRTG